MILVEGLVTLEINATSWLDTLSTTSSTKEQFRLLTHQSIKFLLLHQQIVSLLSFQTRCNPVGKIALQSNLIVIPLNTALLKFYFLDYQL